MLWVYLNSFAAKNWMVYINSSYFCAQKTHARMIAYRKHNEANERLPHFYY